MRLPCIVQQQVKIKNNLHLQQQLYLQNYFLKKNNEKINYLVSKSKINEQKQYIALANIIQNLEEENRLIMNKKKNIYDEKDWYWDEDFENI
tara:strand:+ start:2590 stop:2865 length:276 start_codon:yes stop_codon:yes gene_type:complete